ncbi:hypothetical protein [Actinopolymorpha pittospori]|uniref:Uncharacterized protein n=1 Tax=Actinopolymorpha pittospori TaxID=648752 RepID=A0A927MQW0_9ACTN|nr:hypothetical protein [Actinopolymorpha pittospori]MBE1603238.1 hypothetical protein [Actinopolymorpha pittospori]
MATKAPRGGIGAGAGEDADAEHPERRGENAAEDHTRAAQPPMSASGVVDEHGVLSSWLIPHGGPV